MTGLNVQLKVYGTVGPRRDSTLVQTLPHGTTVAELKRLVQLKPELELGEDVNVRLIFQGQLLTAEAFVADKVPQDGFVHCFVSAKPSAVAKRPDAPKRQRLRHSGARKPDPASSSFLTLASYALSLPVLMLFWFCYYETPKHFDVLAVTSLVGFTTLWVVMATGQLAQVVLAVCEDAPPPRQFS